MNVMNALVSLGDTNQSRNLHIVSWNVAGWTTTLKRIIKHNGSLQIWMNKHAIDILCIQEVKITYANIFHDAGATGLDFEAFFGCPRSSKEGQGNGLNGVATFARKGLTQSASSSMLEYEELNNEGRCLFTDHGDFVIFNLYVPNSGEHHCRYQFKMKFLESLLKAVHEQRLLGKKVIVLGDLNIAPRPVDVCRSYRKILITDILENISLQTLPDLQKQTLFCPTLNRDLTDHERDQLVSIVAHIRAVWEDVEHALKNTVSVETSETKIKEKVCFTYKVKAIRGSDEKRVQLGKSNTSIPHKPYNLDGEIMIEKSETFVISVPGMLYFDDFKEVIIKLAPPPSNSNGSSNMSFLDIHWDLLSDYFGRIAHVQSSVDWYYRLLEEENLVDAYAVSRPDAQGRATCWNQSENRRFSNMGNKIDHILVSQSWWEECGVIGTTLAGEEHENDRHRASLWACTAGGRFRPAPQEGTGLEEGSREAYDEQFRPPHTGIVYFPPDYSDHVGVSIVIGITSSVSPLKLRTDPATRKTQPHSLQSTMTSHFTKRSDVISSDTTSTISISSSNTDVMIFKDQASSSSSLERNKGEPSSLSCSGSKKPESFFKPPIVRSSGTAFFASSSSSTFSTSSLLPPEERTSSEEHSLSSSSSLTEEHSLPHTTSSTSTSASLSSLPSISSLSVPSASPSIAANVRLISKPKGKNEPAKKKSKTAVVGKNDVNAVKITSFFAK